MTLADRRGPFGNPTSDSARSMVTASTSRVLCTFCAQRPSGRPNRGRPGANRPALPGFRRRQGSLARRHIILERPFRSDMRVVAIVAAGGQGARLGLPVPKQFVELGGRTILDRSVDALLSCESIEMVIVALPADQASAAAAVPRAATDV